MSVFGVPSGVAKRIEKLEMDFFWNDGIKKKKVRAMNWVSICKSKRLSGLGIGRIKDKGVSILAKWIWHFGNEHSSLWKKVFCAKYGMKHEGLVWDFLEVKYGSPFINSVNKLFDDKGELAGSIVYPFLWLGCVPPKVEVFLWQLLKGRILVRDVLYNFGMPLPASTVCLLCECESESINHLFLHCDWSWKLWSIAIDRWGISSCRNYEFSEWMEGWSEMCHSKANKRVWFVLFDALCWMIWEYRNAVVFRGKQAILSLVLNSVKFRVVLWFKNCGASCKKDLAILLLDVKGRFVDRQLSKVKVTDVLCPPMYHDLVFNVDGSAKGYSSLAGIGGVMCDANGKFLCLFSICVGMGDSIMVEVLAIHRASALISYDMFFLERNITILSYSKSAVSWINGKGFGHLRLVNWVYDIRQFMLSMNKVSIKYTARNCNSLADSLAKAGSGLQAERLEWGL
ncbi:hypothetical protein Ddye_015132 [Dipteronia dyeriana]|uniref:Reverse transcriptase zinc-binding domain-containing protein n=1 Tax=Dipteronia dyeriana TaxID=168575 RepID=A0AAD9WYV4_9ROSI|nr:hypothetical protein Ddye_015132 [Dipteronia dyeriana]